MLVDGRRRLGYTAEPPLPMLELLDGSLQIHRTKIRPHPIRKNQFGVCAFPKQKIAETLLTAGSNQKVHRLRFPEQLTETLPRDRLTRRPLAGIENRIAR